MSDHSLPDEIISEILCPALKVSDEIFSDTSEVSPFAKYSESTSAYLLVCKSWLRVSTPLLYNVVILRSKAQAKALSLALAGNKALGTFIKKLRVEGGYGAPMLTILQCSPNISDLFVSLEIYSSDNSSGLCKGLALLNPTRLILWELYYRPLENKMVSQLLDALEKSISRWDRLTVFDCPFARTTDRAQKVISPLIKSKRLHALAIPRVSASLWAYDIFKECPLKVIHIKEPLEQYERTHYLPRFENEPKLMALLKFTDRTTRALDELEPRQPESALELPLIAPSLNPSFTPLAGASEDVHNKVWARVLHFAMSVPELANGVKSKDIPRRLPLLLVSKTFHRLGLSSYYAHVVLRRPAALTKFAAVLSSDPSIGPHVRSLVAEYWDYIDQSWDSEDESSTDELGFDFRTDADLRSDTMLAVLSRTTGLVRFGGRENNPADMSSEAEKSISWDAFEAMVQRSGSTLRECHVRMANRRSASSSATIFDSFTALRTLAWDSRTTFRVANVPANGLRNLEELRITSTSSSFMVVLSGMKLQSLRCLVLSGDDSTNPGLETLLKAHGPKLADLNLSEDNLNTLGAKIFELCPNIRSLSILGHDAPDVNYFDPPSTFTSLVKVILDVPDYWRSRNLSKDEVVKWGRFFDGFEPENFPEVREIMAHSCTWPTRERDIAKSPWVRWAEMLLERNINLLDTAGTKWRPRLKVK